jgi:hypothetical protein
MRRARVRPTVWVQDWRKRARLASLALPLAARKSSLRRLALQPPPEWTLWQPGWLMPLQQKWHLRAAPGGGLPATALRLAMGWQWRRGRWLLAKSGRGAAQ